MLTSAEDFESDDDDCDVEMSTCDSNDRLRGSGWRKERPQKKAKGARKDEMRKKKTSSTASSRVSRV